MIETTARWTSPEMENYVEFLKRELAKAMALPPWATRSPEAFHEASARVMHETELLRRHIAHLVSRYTVPVMILHRQV